MGAYYVSVAPHHFQRPRLEGLAEILDAETQKKDETTIHLVAEVEGRVIAALSAQLVPAEDGAAYQITPDSGHIRLRVDYVATAEPYRRSGAGRRLVEAAEDWGREHGATVSETWTYHDGPLSMPFWTRRMGYEPRSVNLRKPL
jgi:GNAT superfamily N-acetyltransferase